MLVTNFTFVNERIQTIIFPSVDAIRSDTFCVAVMLLGINWDAADMMFDVRIVGSLENSKFEKSTGRDS